MEEALLIRFLVLAGLSILSGAITGTGSVVGFLIGLPLDLVQAYFYPALNPIRAFALDLASNELEKAAHEAFDQHTEDDEQTERRLRAVARQNPNTTFVYGEVSTEDVAILAGSSIVFAIPQLTETPFYWATDLAFEITGFRG
jgi:hypothetical protein